MILGYVRFKPKVDVQRLEAKHLLLNHSELLQPDILTAAR
jgi:hypothetical protein